MKTIKQIREDYDNIFLSQVEFLPEEIMLDEVRGIVTTKEMPIMLVFRRIQYRNFPGKQIVALYYSKTINKYLSIPFGREGNVNLSEATIYDTIEDLELEEGAKWEAVKGGVKGATQGALKGFFKGNAVAAEPGMAIGAVVGGVHGAYKGAKNAYNKSKDKNENLEENMKDIVTKVIKNFVTGSKDNKTTNQSTNQNIVPVSKSQRTAKVKTYDASKLAKDRSASTTQSKLNQYDLARAKEYSKKPLQASQYQVSEDWQSVNRKDRTDGLSQAAVNAYRRENPGSKLSTAVTEKNPTGKRAARRKSFCSRMGGMKKRLTSAKTARDPDSRINKALRRWNCEESFRQKLYEKRMQQYEGIVGDTIEKGRKYLQNKVKDSKTFKAIQNFGHTLPGYEDVKTAKQHFAKGDYVNAARSTVHSLGKAAATGAAAAGVVGAGVIGARALPFVANAAKSLLSSGEKDKDKGKEDDRVSAEKLISVSQNLRMPKVKTYAASDVSKDRSASTTQSKLNQYDLARARESAKKPLKASQYHENKVSDIKNMINEGVDLMNLSINGRTVTLNNSMAKRIVEVYDSVNTKNKKIVEGMLNDDLDSFKRLLNFSIKV